MAYPYGCFERSRDVAYCYDALFETKRGFGQINNGQASISDNWLGQMTAEALVGRLNRNKLDPTEQYVHPSPSLNCHTGHYV